jgi:hypothetical protein
MTSTSAPASEAPAGKYVLIFAAVQAALGLALAALESALKTDLGTGSSIGTLVAGVAVAMHYFARDHRRGMTRGEQLRFAAWGMLVSLIWSAMIFFAILLYLAGARDFATTLKGLVLWVRSNAGIAALVAAGATLFLFAFLYFGSGLFSRQFARQLNAPTNSPTPKP